MRNGWVQIGDRMGYRTWAEAQNFIATVATMDKIPRGKLGIVENSGEYWNATDGWVIAVARHGYAKAHIVPRDPNVNTVDRRRLRPRRVITCDVATDQAEALAAMAALEHESENKEV
jgi:hypothetical protein